MSSDTEKMLADRLKQIDTQIENLKAEKAKVKQALSIFRETTEGLLFTNMAQKISGEPTFKEKVKDTLANNFQSQGGATALQILDSLNKNWKRQVKRESLSPQLSRLKDEGVLVLNNGFWCLTDRTLNNKIKLADSEVESANE